MAIKTQTVMVLRTVNTFATGNLVVALYSAAGIGEIFSLQKEISSGKFLIIADIRLDTDASPNTNGMGILAVSTDFEFPVKTSEAATVFTGGDVPLMRATLRNLREQHGTV